MNPIEFVETLCDLNFENVFNPYSGKYAVHDLDDAPRRRSNALLAMLKAASDVEVDAIWIGRDLGYRGGRRTGLALTDDMHISSTLHDGVSLQNALLKGSRLSSVLQR